MLNADLEIALHISRQFQPRPQRVNFKSERELLNYTTAHGRMAPPPVPKPAPGNQNSIAAQYARAKAAKDAEDEAKVKGLMGQLERPKTVVQKLNERREARFNRDWSWVVGFFVWLL